MRQSRHRMISGRCAKVSSPTSQRSAMASFARDELADCPAPFGLRSFRPGQREVIETVAGRQRLPVRHAHRRRQKPVLPVAGHRRRRRDAGGFAADRADEGPGRAPAGAGPAGHVHQQHALARGAGASGCDAMAAGEYQLVYVVPERFRSPRFVEAAPASRRAAAGGRRGALRQRVGARFPPRLRPAGTISATAGQSAHDRPDGHGHRRRASRHRRAAGSARAGGVHHRLCPAQPVLRRARLPDRPREGRAAVQVSGREPRLGHHLRLDPQALRGAGRDGSPSSRHARPASITPA